MQFSLWEMIFLPHVYFVSRLCFCRGAGKQKVDFIVKRHTGYSNLLLLLLVSRPVFQQCGWNNSHSNLHWMERHLRLFAVHQAAFVFQKNFQSIQLESKIPHQLFLFFLTSVPLLSFSAALQILHLVPLFPSLSWPSVRNCRVKRQDWLFAITFIHQHNVLCFLWWVYNPFFQNIGVPCFALSHKWNAHFLSNKWTWGVIHRGYNKLTQSLFHNREGGG